MSRKSSPAAATSHARSDATSVTYWRPVAPKLALAPEPSAEELPAAAARSFREFGDGRDQITGTPFLSGPPVRKYGSK